MAEADDFLITGTGCSQGHEPGAELEAAGIGRVPSRRTTWIGVALIAWGLVGIALLAGEPWFTLSLVALALWLSFSAMVQSRLGHRGRCWRVRAWRHAWGGLVPTGSDPTRAAQ